MIGPLGNDTITLVKPDLVVDPRDNSTRIDWSSPTEIPVLQCMVQPFLMSDKMQQENNSDRDYSRATWRVWAPVTADTIAIEAHDRVEFQNVTYELFGQVQQWRDFNGVNSHCQFILQRRLG